MSRFATTVELDDGITIQFSDGREVTVRESQISAKLVKALFLHGLKQKLRDSFSGANGDLNYAFAECQGVADSLIAGNWNRRGTGNSDLIEALVRLTKQDRQEISAHVATLTPERRDAIKKEPLVKAELAKIKAERLAANVGEDTEVTLEDIIG